MLPIFGVGQKYDNAHNIVSHDVCDLSSMLSKISINLNPNTMFRLLCEWGDILCFKYYVGLTDDGKVICL